MGAAASTAAPTDAEIKSFVKRSYADDPERTAALVAAATSAFNEASGKEEPSIANLTGLDLSDEEHGRSERGTIDLGVPKERSVHFRPRSFSASMAAMDGLNLVENMVHQEFNRDVNEVYVTANATTLGTGLSGTVVKVSLAA
jgi:hypothetical protein